MLEQITDTRKISCILLRFPNWLKFVILNSIVERQSRDAGAGNCNGGRGVYQIFCCGTPVGNATRQTSVQKCFDRLYSAMKLRYGCFTLTMKVVVVAQLIYLIYSNEIDHLQNHVSDYIKDAVVFQIISWNDMRGTCVSEQHSIYFFFQIQNTQQNTRLLQKKIMKQEFSNILINFRIKSSLCWSGICSIVRFLWETSRLIHLQKEGKNQIIFD